MPTQDAVRERLRGLLVELTGRGLPEAPPEARLSDLGVDSVTAVELVAAVEDAYDLSIPEEDAVHLTTVAAVVRYVTRHAA